MYTVDALVFGHVLGRALIDITSNQIDPENASELAEIVICAMLVLKDTNPQTVTEVEFLENTQKLAPDASLDGLQEMYSYVKVDNFDGFMSLFHKGMGFLREHFEEEICLEDGQNFDVTITELETVISFQDGKYSFH